MLKNNEIAFEALTRSENIRRKRKRHVFVGTMISVSGALVIVFASGIAYRGGPLPGDPGRSYVAQANTALFGDSAIGGYVIIGIAAFFMGVIITLICKHWIEKHR